MLEQIKNFLIDNWIALTIFIVCSIIIFIRTKKRGFFWKVKKTGEQLKFKEFMKRWRRGVEGITQLQISRTEVIGGIIVCVGLISGIVSMAIFRPKDMWWWIIICLSGGLLLNLLGVVGSLQKYWRCKKIEDTIKEINNQRKKDIDEPQNVSISGDTKLKQRQTINSEEMSVDADNHAGEGKEKLKSSVLERMNQVAVERPIPPSKEDSKEMKGGE